MRVVVSTESRLIRTPDGRTWAPCVTDYSLWRRYLTAFDEVRVLARVLDQATPPDGADRADGEGVEVVALPHYIGPAQYLWHRATLGRGVAAAASPEDAVILRVPSPIGSLLAAERVRRALPYAVEVIGDPYDVFAPGVIRHPLRPWFRRRFADRLRRECRHAVAAAYVTESALQARYPPAPGTPTAAYSSIDLPAQAYAHGPRPAGHRSGPVPTLISVGSLEQLYKGIDTLIEAVARLIGGGTAVRLVHIGAGRYRGHLERLAARRGVSGAVTFTGRVAAGGPVREHLDAADLFVLPSRTEGLPRALLEAMARGLPAVATPVGGIPELLPARDLVSPDDPAALAQAIAGFLGDDARLAAASARNLARAQDYSRECLDPRRAAFYATVRDATRRPPVHMEPDPRRGRATLLAAHARRDDQG